MRNISKVNGFNVISFKIPHLETISIGAWVNVGTRHEPENLQGISHFLEHMVFKGTETRTAYNIAAAIENVGGILNAYTTRESTAYYAKIIKEDVSLAMDLISDMLLRPNFAEAELQKERQVILQEIAQTNDNPSDIIFDYFQEQAFKGSPLSIPVLGFKSSIQKISSLDLKNYVKKYFENPGNIIFSAAGNIEHSMLEDLISKYWPIVNTNFDSRNLTQSKYVGGVTFKDVRNLEQSNIILGFQGENYTSPHYYDLQIFSNILGGGMSSKLFQKIREDLGLAYSIYSFTSSYKDCGTFGIFSGTNHENCNKVSDTIISEIGKFEISNEELNRAKNQLRASILMDLENTSTIADTLATEAMNRSIPQTIEEIIENINNVTSASVMNIAQKICRSEITKVIIS